MKRPRICIKQGSCPSAPCASSTGDLCLTPVKPLSLSERSGNCGLREKASQAVFTATWASQTNLIPAQWERGEKKPPGGASLKLLSPGCEKRIEIPWGLADWRF